VTAPVQAPPPPVTKSEPWLSSLHPVYRLILRWAFIASVTVLAFHRSLLDLVETTRAGALNGYVWLVPVAAVLAAIGVAHRNRTELPIHDRQTDVIVGIMGLVLSLLLHAVLLQRYALYFHLLRLDLVALWTFVLSACIAVFGLRPVTRFAWVWVLLLAVFPLPYHIVVGLFGGNRVAAGVGTLVIGAVAGAIAIGRHRRRAIRGALGSWMAGLAILASMSIWFPHAPTIAFQAVPAGTAICLTGGTGFLISRRDEPKRLLDRKIEPLAAAAVWSAIPVVLVVAIALSLVRLPNPGTAPVAQIDRLRTDSNTSLAAPDGWHIIETQHFGWVQRIYGEDAELIRQQMVPDNGDLRLDKFGRPRELVVDAISTRRPTSLTTLPAQVLYRVTGIRRSSSRWVDLGYGVTADLFTAVDDQMLVTWDGLQWTWSNGVTAQRVVVISVDNHDDNAPFPPPTGGVLSTLNSLFTVLFRGNSATSDRDPTIKDGVLLTEFGRALVRAQLEPLGVEP
jgi:hypothetical protein